MMSMFAEATRALTGWPLKVKPWAKTDPLSPTNGSSTRSAASTAPIGL